MLSYWPLSSHSNTHMHVHTHKPIRWVSGGDRDAIRSPLTVEQGFSWLNQPEGEQRHTHASTHTQAHTHTHTHTHTTELNMRLYNIKQKYMQRLYFISLNAKCVAFVLFNQDLDVCVAATVATPVEYRSSTICSLWWLRPNSQHTFGGLSFSSPTDYLSKFAYARVCVCVYVCVFFDG